MTDKAKKATKRRPRRSSAEVRHLMLVAAREVFAAAGYTGATTKEIALRADVDEAVLFRNFPTKEALFEAAILEPFGEFVADYTERWRDAELPEGSPSEVMRQYVLALDEMVRQNRALFAALGASRLAGPAMQDLFARLEEMGEQIAAAHGLTYDTPVAVRAAFMMILSVALNEDDLFPGHTFPHERVLDGLTDMLTGALLHKKR